jgi:hypothetical protein
MLEIGSILVCDANARSPSSAPGRCGQKSGLQWTNPTGPSEWLYKEIPKKRQGRFSQIELLTRNLRYKYLIIRLHNENQIYKSGDFDLFFLGSDD